MGSLPEDVDVLIVGYGPVGAAIAGLLGRYGIRTLVVDKSPDIYVAPRAIALDNEALRIIQMVGLTEDAFAKVPIPIVRMHCAHVGEFGSINTAGSIDGHPKLVTFYRPELERALRAHAERQPTVSARTGVEMIRFVDDVWAGPEDLVAAFVADEGDLEISGRAPANVSAREVRLNWFEQLGRYCKKRASVPVIDAPRRRAFRAC